VGASAGTVEQDIAVTEAAVAAISRQYGSSTGKIIKTYSNHSNVEIGHALDVAAALYKSDWSQGPIQPRLEVLVRLADIVEGRAQELARILALEMGKRLSEAGSEVGITAPMARFYAQNPASFLAPEKIDTPYGNTWVQYQPIGVIVAVEPWNFPYYQLVRVA